MAYVRRRRLARRTTRPRRPVARRRGLRARVYRPLVRYNYNPTFTETLDAGSLLSSNSGVAGVFSWKISDVPQWANYSQLYTQ